jgi:hypothetical protein
MALFFGHALPYMATNNDGNLYAELLPADQRVEAASGTQEIAGGCLDSRVVDLRSRVEEQLNANLLFNSSMAGATGSVLPTNWASGSVSGLTYTISSASTVKGFRSIEWTVSGTALSDGDIYLACEPMQSGSVVAQIPNEYVGSMYCAKVSGTIKAVMVLQTLTQNFVDGAVQETKTKDLAAVTGQTFVRVEPNSVKTDIDLENRVNLRLYQPIASGEVIDFTIRVAAPQVEAGFVASPFISTVSGAVSEVRGRPSILVVPQLTKEGVVYPQIPVVSGADFTFTRATTATRVNASGLIESVASGVLRLDYPITGGCPAALIEPAGTNFARNVQFMTGQDTPAASGGMTITTGSTDFLAPDGTSGSITKYVGGAASGGVQYAYFSGGNVTFTASGQHTFSLFVKAGTTNPLNFCAIGFTAYTGGSGTAISYFSLASGTALTAGASIQDYGNGWYRLISAPYTIASGDLAGNILFYQAEGNNDVNFPASGALDLTAYIWGAQVETGAIPTSYIPTTTASATRAADVCSVSGVSGYIGQTEGTIYAEVDVRNLTDGRILTIFKTSSQYILLSKATSRLGGAVIDTTSSPTTVVNLQTASGSLTSGIYKLALAYKQNDFAFYVNGIQVGTSTSGNVIGDYSSIRIGNFDTSLFFNDRLRAAAIYTTRLDNTTLANITRLT